MLRRRVWLIVLPPVVTLFGALIYSSTIQNLYQSDMLIAIVPQRVPDAFVRSTVTLRTEERLDAMSVQVKSRTNLEEMIAEFDLYPEERRKLPLGDIVVRMRASIAEELERARPGQRGPEPPHAFHVRFTYPDPNVAARVTQRLGSLFVDQNAQDRGALAGATNQFLEAQLGEARARLEAQERRLEAFRERHGNELPTQLQTNLQVIQSSQLQIQAVVESIARDRDRKLMLERLLRDAENEPRPAPPVQGREGTAPGETPLDTASLDQQLIAARASLARLEGRLRPEHPDVIRAKRLIADLEVRAAAEPESRTVAAMPASTPEDSQRRERLREMAAEIESLDRQTQFKQADEGRLRSLVAEYQRRIEAVPGIESEFVALTRDYDTHQAAYKDLLTKSEASKVAVDLEQRQIGEHFRILDPAVVPVHPLSSMRAPINAGGLAMGLILGLGLAAFLEVRDASFRTEADVLDLLALPVLATIPSVDTAQDLLQRRRKHLIVACVAFVAVSAGGYVTWSLKLWNSVL